MGQHARRESYSGPFPSSSSRFDNHRRIDFPDKDTDLVSPLAPIDGLNCDDIRETAYEIFFTACRSSPGFGGRSAITFYSNYDNNGDSGGASKPNQVVSHPNSRLKRALGLKMIKRSPSRRMVTTGTSGGSSSPSSPVGQGGSSPLSYTVPASRPRRPMTSAEIMRQQMRVTEQSDNRLRKTLMRTLVGQMGRRADTIILPLELLRQLKPSEFNDSTEYHMWQKRQLKILEAGLLLHPSIPLDKSNTFAARLRDIIRSAHSKPIDTGKNSDTMRTLCNSVVSLSWRSSNGTPTDVCHWVDGFPLNLHLYTSLLHSVFDTRDETLVLDEIDELLELMKKTWTTLGISRPIHNVCFTWVLFQQYIATGQIESDLLSAAHAMLIEVGSDAKKEKDAMYLKILSSVLSSMQSWAEKKLVNYHDYFVRGTAGQIENLLPLVLTASKIMGEDVVITDGEGPDKGDITIVDSSGDRVDYYIRSSIRNAFDKVIDAENAKAAESEIKEEMSQVLIRIAHKTEELAIKERESYSPVLRKWEGTAGAIAALTLHSCYGHVLRQYLGEVTSLTTEMVEVLQRAGRLEKFLVQMVVEESAECDDGGKNVVREMIPYEVDSVILNFLRRWIDESLDRAKECYLRAKETETWNPKSKSEPHALSAVELMNMAKGTVEEFFKTPIGITEDLVVDLAEGMESIVQNYTSFVAACGSKQSYIPSLPPLTRCNRDSKFLKLWKKASPCSATVEEENINGSNEGHHPRPSTSRGTQRLYIRLNTLHYLLSNVQALDKSLSLTPGAVPSTTRRHANNRRPSSRSSYFDIVTTSLQAACQHVSEVAAYRLIFLDSCSVFYDGLYLGDVANSRIRPALRTLKQNLTVMTAILTDRAQALAMKEVMKASFEAFLMVLLAGGSSRVFNRSDYQMIQEDFESLKRVFCSCGEGLIAEEVVQREAEVVEGVIELMGLGTDQLVEDFSIVTCETSGIGMMGNAQKLPMPPTTGRWNRSDPNTILRVLCHRNDRAANQFLKKTFQLAKRR
ncbi:protein unc-13-like protein [Senna tora]|uniref:Protein unc-13-like protein n=1 Tax=Senna tora TaxID=362788 RepID=A0A835CFZ8_9FABA|nr:protein unc-13-like protein [Senna tora]